MRCRVVVFLEKGKHFAIECGNVTRLTAGDPVLVAHYFAIDPVAARIANVILDGVIAGQGSSAGQSS